MDSRDVTIKKEKLKILETTPRIKQIIIDILSYYDWRDRDKVCDDKVYSVVIEEVERYWKQFIQEYAEHKSLEQGTLFKK